jgi:hypothetical protein
MLKNQVEIHSYSQVSFQVNENEYERVNLAYKLTFSRSRKHFNRVEVGSH